MIDTIETCTSCTPTTSAGRTYCLHCGLQLSAVPHGRRMRVARRRPATGLLRRRSASR